MPLLQTGVLGANNQRPRDPLPSAAIFSQLNQGCDTHVGGPGIFGMKDQRFGHRIGPRVPKVESAFLLLNS